MLEPGRWWELEAVLWSLYVDDQTVDGGSMLLPPDEKRPPRASKDAVTVPITTGRVLRQVRREWTARAKKLQVQRRRQNVEAQTVETRSAQLERQQAELEAAMRAGTSGPTITRE